MFTDLNYYIIIFLFMKLDNWDIVLINTDFLPQNHNPRRFFDWVVSDNSENALNILGNWWVSFKQDNDASWINSLRESLNNVLQLNNKELIIDFIISALNPNRPISDIIEIFFLIKELDLVQDLYLRFVHISSWSMLSKSQVYKDDINKINSDFQEVLVEWGNDNIVLPDTKNRIIKSYLDHHLICWYNYSWEDIEWKMNELVFKLLKTIIEKINYDEKLLSAYVDSLTKVPNKKALIWNINKLEKDKTPTWMMIIDIDDFKSVNDKYNDKAWDKVLITFSNILLNVLKKYNWGLYRLTWEKFAVIVPNSSWTDQIIDISKEIHKELLNNSLVFDNRELYNIKFNAGVWFKDWNDDIDLWQLWTFLEKCKYFTKYLQRNWITVFQKEDAGFLGNIKNWNKREILFFGLISQLTQNKITNPEKLNIHYLGWMDKVII